MKRGYLYYYKKWMRAAEMPSKGLCASLPYHLANNEIFEMITPTPHNEWELFHIDHSPRVYWGKEDFNISNYELTPRRQTILILLAILNGEKV